MQIRRLLILVLVTTIPGLGQAQPAGVDDILALERPAPDARIPYGDGPLQFGELRLPKGDGPFPVAVIIHGGCWLSRYDLGHISALAAALTAEGMATWSLEYRRVGDPGGGFPGTFQDVAQGTDHLRRIAEEYPLDLSRVIVIGHSAGGQLALWLAGRATLPEGSDFTSDNRVPLTGVLALAPAADLEALYESGSCNEVVKRMLGGSPLEHPQRYRQTSPPLMVPLGVPQIVLTGDLDTVWTPFGHTYFEAARDAGDPVRRVTAPESGHFEMIMPGSTTWPLVRDAALELISQRREATEYPPVEGQVVFLYYRDLAAAESFYESTLGLKKTFDLGWVKIYSVTGGASIGIVDETRGFHRTSPAKPVMVSIVTSDVAAWFARLKASGAEIIKPLEATGQAPVRSFIARDPGGYTIEFFQWQ